MESYSSDSSYHAFASESSVSDYSSPQNLRNVGARSTNVKCRYFMNNGYCFYGENCQFQHVSGGNMNGPSQAKQDQYYNTSEGNFKP